MHSTVTTRSFYTMYALLLLLLPACGTAGKVLGAGTDADVFISLKGSNGTFGPYTLPAGPEAFETGCRDTFKLATPDIGDLQEVVIGHNNMGMGAAWFLQGLELLNLNTGDQLLACCK